MPLIIAPGVVEMRDASNQTYLADEELSYILINRRVWTDTETQELMIDDVSYHQKQCIASHRLADWWYRIMSLSDLPSDLDISFRDGNARNVTYGNLKRERKEA